MDWMYTSLIYDEDLDNQRKILIEKETELKDLTEQLADLTKMQLQLTNDCAQIRVGPNQINSVEKILQDSMINEVTLNGFKNTLLQTLKDDIYLRASKQVENNIDLLIQKQIEK